MISRGTKIARLILNVLKLKTRDRLKRKLIKIDEK